MVMSGEEAGEEKNGKVYWAMCFRAKGTGLDEFHFISAEEFARRYGGKALYRQLYQALMRWGPERELGTALVPRSRRKKNAQRRT